MTGRMHLVLAFTIFASVMAVSQSRGPARGYYNKEFKVGFRYPANWKLDGQSGAVPDDPAWTYFASISLPENAYRGILSHASATISVGKTSESECIVFKSPDGDDSNKPVRTKIGEKRSTRFRAVT